MMWVYRLGLEPLAAVSAEHGGGAFDVLEALVARIPRTENDRLGAGEGVMKKIQEVMRVVVSVLNFGF